MKKIGGQKSRWTVPLRLISKNNLKIKFYQKNVLSLYKIQHFISCYLTIYITVGWPHLYLSNSMRWFRNPLHITVHIRVAWRVFYSWQTIILNWKPWAPCVCVCVGVCGGVWGCKIKYVQYVVAIQWSVRKWSLYWGKRCSANTYLFIKWYRSSLQKFIVAE